MSVTLDDGTGQVVVSGLLKSPAGSGYFLPIPLLYSTASSSFNAVANAFYQVNPATGIVTVTLPTSSVGQVIYIKNIGTAGTGGLTAYPVNVTGTINGGTLTLPLKTTDQAKAFIPDGSGGWLAFVGDISLNSLDLRYGQLATANTWSLAQSFSVIPTAPTPTAGDSSTNLATTAFVAAALSGAVSGITNSHEATAAASTNQTLSGLPTVDGITLTAGQTIFLFSQTTASQNGLWIVASGAWTRPTFFATGSNAAGNYVYILQGTTYGSTGFILSGASSIIVDTNAQNWTQFTGAGEITVGAGVTKTGNNIAVDQTLVATTTNTLNLSNKTLIAPVISTSLLPTATASVPIGSPSLYYTNVYASRYYLNSTAYLDGGTAGRIAATGDLVINGGSNFLFNGPTDTNWRAGKGIANYTRAVVTSGIDYIVGNGSTDGLTIGVTGGNSIMELYGTNGNVYFRNLVGFGTSNPSNRITLGQGYNLTGDMPAPTGVTATLTAGGSLTSGTPQYYKVSALDPYGETLASVEVTVTPTGATLSATIGWNNVNGASSFNIYRTTTSGVYGATSLLTNVTQSSTHSFIDTGALTLASGTVKTVTTASNIRLNTTNGTASWINGGNVGIGTSTPQQQLHVYNPNSYTTLLIETGNDAPTLNLKGSGGTTSIVGAYNGNQVYITPGGSSAAGINNGNQMQIAAAGYTMETNDATAGQTIKQSMAFNWHVKYWNGTSSQYNNLSITPTQVDTIGNFKLAFTIAATELLSLWNGTLVGINTGSTKPTSTLTLNGSFGGAYLIANTAVALSASHYEVELTAAAAIPTLPLSTSCSGREYILINVFSSAISVATTSPDTVGNTGAATSYSIPSGSTIIFVSNGAGAWRIK